MKSKSSQTTIVINVAEDFSDLPIGRKIHERFMCEPNMLSGEAFKRNLLIPALKTGKPVIIDMSNVYGFGSSWLNEVFGGLHEDMDSTKQELTKRIDILCIDDKMTLSSIYNLYGYGKCPYGNNKPKSFIERILNKIGYYKGA